MNDQRNEIISNKNLREQAEAFLARLPQESPDLSEEERRRLVHNLSVHQVELEIQNEELRNIQHEMEVVRDRYARLYQQAPVGYLSLDASGIIHQFNYTFLEMMGGGNLDLLGQPLANFMAESDRKFFLGRFRGFFRQPENKTIDVLLLRGKNGSGFHARLNGRLETPVALPSQPPRHPLLLMSVSDVSAQIAAEKALRDSEQRFRDLSALTSDWFWEQDAQFRFTYFSSAGGVFGGEQSGIDTTQWLGKPLWQLSVELTFEQWAKHRAVLVARESFRDFEFQMLMESGEIHWFSLNGLPLFDAAKRFTGYRGTARDVTERRRLQEAKRLALIPQKTTNIVIMTNAAGLIEWVNPAFTSHSGYTLSEALGKKPGALLQGPETDPAVVAHMRECLARKVGFDVEILNYHKSGTPHWAVVKADPVFDQHGGLQHYIAIKHDITERKRSYAELWELATTDSLTRLSNRRCFIDRLERELARLQRTKDQPAAVLMLDLDHFKRINDTHGHAAGDVVLQHFAALMRAELRKIDTVGRLGGEEFAILLSGATLDAARVFAERLHEKVRKTPLLHDGQAIPITVSIGVTAINATDASPIAILMRADQALYQAKEQGRNRTVIAAVRETPTPGFSVTGSACSEPASD